MSNSWTAVSILASTLALSACGLGSPVLRAADGKLAACPPAPHCVSSLASGEQQVAPLRYTGAAAAARERLARTIAGLPRYAVLRNEGDYLYASYTSPLMRYVDDLELVFSQSEPGRIEVRSSSRIGYYDFGANRAHVEELRAAFKPSP
ncbi:DUF1499 domain-containing protein [Stagnimonas aquatica]|uniref:DUF1499 domain-containing protein n=1 Tax=Stagnimonas aquatica TaxID=2689987 RepID=A0A3N0VGI1_9GAMM|nr:DUF1499 domain-containing protein [Stagnimonas aquatica]ROH91805.1 DUF1499 domain-containing protein [Stagnimonas aquatica]